MRIGKKSRGIRVLGVLRTASILTKTIAIVALALIVLTSVLLVFTNNRERNIFYDSIENQHRIFENRMNESLSDLKSIHSELGTTLKVGDPKLNRISDVLSLVTQNERISNAYIMDSEIKDAPDGSRVSRLIALNNEIQASGALTNLDEYPSYPIFEDAVNRIDADGGVARTDVYDDGGVQFISTMSKIKDSDGTVLGIFAIDFDYSGIASTLRTNALTLACVGFGLSLLMLISVGVALGFQLKPIKGLVRFSEQVTSGDLTGRMVVTRQDELGVLQETFNTMVTQLNVLVLRLKDSAALVTDSSVLLSSKSKESTYEVTNISSEIERLSVFTEAQLRGTSETARAITDIASGISKIASSASLASTSSSRSLDLAQQGVSVVEEAVSIMNQVKSNANETGKRTQVLLEEYSKVKDISAIISQVADSTNLLSLNASIEAARAGDSGRGFAVVADEIRKLATQVSSHAKSIADIVYSLSGEAVATAEVASQGVVTAERGSVAVARANDLFVRIIQDVEEATSQIKGLSVFAEDMSANTEEITSFAMNNEQNSRSVSDASNSILDSVGLNASISTDISNLSVRLSDAVSIIENNIRVFKVQSEDVA